MQATPRRTARRLGVILAVVAMLAAALSTAGDAQEAGEPAPPDETGAGFELVEKLPSPEGTVVHEGGKDTASDLYMWPQGRLGYMVSGSRPSTATSDNLSDDPRAAGLVAVDLDTLEVVARTDDPGPNPLWLDRRLIGCGFPCEGRFPGMAIDRENGLLYVAHHNAIHLPSDETPSSEEVDRNQAACHPEAVQGHPCFAGVYVLDAETLEVIRDIPFRQVGTDGVGVQWSLSTLTFSEPRTDGDEPKLHVVVTESVHRAVAIVDGVAGGPITYTRTAQQYAAQIDLGTPARTEWLTQLNGCTGSNTSNTAHPPGSQSGVLFRSPDIDSPRLWVGCWASGHDASTIIRVDLEESDPEDQGVAGQQRFLAPLPGNNFLVDRGGRRLLVKSGFSEQLWWVFDLRREAFVGRLGVGPMGRNETADVLDPTTGRLYTYAPKVDDADGSHHPGGLGFTDVRREEFAQYRWDASLAKHWRDTEGRSLSSGLNNEFLAMAVDPGTDDRPTRIFVRPSEEAGGFLVLEDPHPITTDAERDTDRSRTHDVPEREGATTARFNGSARGYGFHTVTVRGLGGALQPGNIADAAFYNLHSPCWDSRREAAFGLAGSPHAGRLSSIDQLGSATATARPSFVDATTRGDLGAPYTRCRSRELLGQDRVPTWEDIRSELQVRGDALEEPNADRVPGTDPASCVAPNRPEDSTGDDVFTGFEANVRCDTGHIAGDARASLVGDGPVDLAGAGSTYDVERRDGGGIVSRVDAWARGVSITGDQGTATIDLIRTTVEAWANGRSQPDDADDDANCDTDRTAGSCFRRAFSGVTITDASGQAVFSCEQCEDEDDQQQIVDGLDRILGNGWLVSAPEPNQVRAAGAEDGASVGIIKTPAQRFTDKNLKADLLPTLPGLELVRLNDSGSGENTGGPGRQTFQFAGVETSLTYGIICLKEVVDGQCQGSPASLTISLTDVDGDPLEGGLFQVQPDADGDGQIGVEESLEQPLACTTGPDGICGFDPIAAGSYVVHQAAAPPGYLPAPDKAIDLPEGGQGRLDIVNGTPAVTGIKISLHDTSTPAQPLEGAEFQVHAGTEAAGAPAAGCTTNATGTCVFEVPAVGGIDPVTDLVGQDLTHVLQVPAGPYVLHQSSAPDGYRPADDVAFDLPDGQIARVDLTNGVMAAGDGIGAAPSPSSGGTSDGGSAAEAPVAFQQPSEVPAPQFTINVNVQQEAPAPAPQVAGDEGNTINVFANPVQSAKLLLRDPKEAAAFAAAWLLFGAAAAAAWRRRMILAQFDI